jgi:hypothetical protein
MYIDVDIGIYKPASKGLEKMDEITNPYLDSYHNPYLRHCVDCGAIVDRGTTAARYCFSCKAARGKIYRRQVMQRWRQKKRTERIATRLLLQEQLLYILQRTG